MCLVSKNGSIGYVADDDIICYKFVRLVGFKDGIAQFVTPTQNYPVKVNDYLVAEGELDIDTSFFGDTLIDGGIIHCYQNLIASETWKPFANCVALRCIIPAGEVFYINDIDYRAVRDNEIGARRVFVTDEIVNLSFISKGLEKTRTLDNVSYHEVGESYQLRIPFDYAELEKVG